MSNDDERPELIRVAEAISDGIPLDWTAEDTPGVDRALIEPLRAIESIAKVHRESATDAAGSTAGAPVAASGAPTAPPPSGEHETWGSLLLLERISGGGFGDVYRAWDPALEREVALKLFRTGGLGSAAHRYLDEARRLARVRHPNVVVVHGVDERDGRVGLWTDLLQGRTLAEWLADHGPLSAHEAAVIGMELCRALAAVHAAGLVHRDVKAENVVREAGGRIVLLDFGAVDAPSPQPLSRVELGTPITMAPEQLRGGPVGPTADVYGLGVLLYRLVTGHYPIEAKTLAELSQRHRQGGAVPLRDRRPDLPGEFVRVVEKAIDPLPENRYESAGEMERALAVVSGAVPRGATGTAPGRKSAAWPTIVLASATILFIGAIMLAARGPWGPASRGHESATRSEDVGHGTVAPAPVRASTGEAAARGGTPVPPVTATAALYLDRASGPVRLESGDRIAPGDAVFLRVDTSESAYLYVLDEDDRGVLYALYPVPGATPGNPLAGSSQHRLPGSLGGKPFDWQVTSAGGSEDICVIASRTPIAALESELAHVPHAHPGVPISYARLPSETVDRLRGLDGMTEAVSPDTAPNRRLADLMRSLHARPQSADEPWIWELVLENSGR
jgi:serine/threonine-protein kinase